MENLGLHKSKLYSVILAAIGIISCLLPWWHISFNYGGFGGGGVSINGLHKLGIVTFIAFIAAGAVVTKDVPPYALMAGVPAKQIGWVCYCGNTLKNKNDGDAIFICHSCGKHYKLEDNHLTQLDN